MFTTSLSDTPFIKYSHLMVRQVSKTVAGVNEFDIKALYSGTWIKL